MRSRAKEIRAALRDILTILAAALILVLTAALVGPWFIDWTAQRSWVESELSRLSGAKVRVAGDIDLKLLPVPRLDASRVFVSGIRAEGPTLDIGRVRLELAVGALMQGELRFTEAVLDRPQLTLTRAEDGAVVLPRTPNFKPTGVQIERLSLVDGSVALKALDGGQPLVIGGLDFLGEAASLTGPFKGAGELKFGTQSARYRFNTGTIENGRVRVKSILDEGALTPRGDLDGTLVLEPSGLGTRLGFEGLAAFSATSTVAGVPVPWRLSGTLKLDPVQAVLDPAELRAGEDDRALIAAGKAIVAFGALPQMSLTMAARQLDVDRLLAEKADQSGSAARLGSIFSAVIGDTSLSDRFPVPVNLALTAPTATLAGEVLTDTQLDLSLASGQPVKLRAVAQGPARSRLLFDGSVETGTAAAFRGRMELGARDLDRFTDWLSASGPDLAARLRGLPFRSLDLAGDVEASAGGVIGRNLAIKTDRSTFAGTIAFTRALGAERARLFADLTSDALDLESVPDLAGPARLAADMDLSLALEARAVRLARVGEGVVDAGRIGVKLLRDKDKLNLERFTVSDLGGASVSATGSVMGDVAKIDASLDAQRLGDLAALLRRVAPGPLADGLSRRATALSPARLSLTGAARVNASGLRFDDLRVEGTARGTRVSLLARPSGDLLDVTASLSSSDAPMLLRQLGAESLMLTGFGSGQVRLTARGSPDTGFDTSLDASALRSDLSFEGHVGGSPLRPTLDGKIGLKSADLTPLLQILAVAMPDLTTVMPVEAKGDLYLAGERIAATDLTGRVAGTSFEGALAFAPTGSSPQVSGSLKLGRLDLPGLASLVLGPMAPAARGARWPENKLSTGLADLPSTHLELEIGQFGLGVAGVGDDARLRLSLAPGSLALEDMTFGLADGKAGGSLTIRRDGATASLSGHATFAQQALKEGPLSAEAEGRIDFTSTGQSYAALAGGLAGTGQVELSNVLVGNADPAALARIVETAAKGGLNIDETDILNSLGREFDRGSVTLGSIPFDATLATGVLRLVPKAASAGPAQLGLTYDLRALTLEARLAVTSLTQPRDWSEAPPAAVLVWQGRSGELRRTIEASPLVNAISGRAIAREAARVDALEADIRERAMFNRRAKAFDFMRRREREVADFYAAQRRAEEQKQLDEQRRVEAEQRRAAEAERLRAARSAADPIGRLLEGNAPSPLPPVRPPAPAGPLTDPTANGRY